MVNQNYKENNIIKTRNLDRIFILWIISFIAMGITLLVKSYLYNLQANNYYYFQNKQSIKIIHGVFHPIEVILSLTFLLENLFLFFTLFLVFFTFVSNYIYTDDQSFKLRSSTILKLMIVVIVWNILGIFSSHRADVFNSLEVNLKIFLGIILMAFLIRDTKEDVKKKFHYIKLFGYLLGLISILFFLFLMTSIVVMTTEAYMTQVYDPIVPYFDPLISIVYIVGGIFLKFKTDIKWNYEKSEITT